MPPRASCFAVANQNSRPFRGLIPFNVFPTAQSNLIPPIAYNQWFSCVLRFSQPLDALLPARSAKLISSWYRSWGFSLWPSAAYDAVRPLRRRLPHEVPTSSSQGFSLLLQGLSTPHKARPQGLGFSQGPHVAATLSFVPLRGFLFNAIADRLLIRYIPSRALSMLPSS